MEHAAEISVRSIAKLAEGVTEAAETGWEPLSALSAQPHPDWAAIADVAQDADPAVIGAVQQAQRSAANIGTSIWQPPPANADSGTAMETASRAARSRRSIWFRPHTHHAHAPDDAQPSTAHVPETEPLQSSGPAAWEVAPE